MTKAARAIISGACLVSWRCAFLSDFDVRQCHSDEECVLRDEGVQHCELARCVAGCASNRHCARVDPRLPICPTRGGECAALTTDDGSCSVVYDPANVANAEVTADAAILVGALLPSAKSSGWLSALMAAEELASRGGLPDASGLPRPLMTFMCEAATASMQTAIEHLVGNVGVRAIVADADDRALALGLNLAQSRGSALFLTPHGSDLFSQGSSDDALWSLGAPGLAVKDAYRALVQDAVLSARQRLAQPQLLEVGMIVAPAREDILLADAVSAELEVEGAGRDALLLEDRLKRVDLVDDSPSQRALQLAELAQRAPDLVLVFAGGRFDDIEGQPRAGVVSELEQMGASLGWQPLYLLGPRSVRDAALVRLAIADASFRSRAVVLSAERRPEPERLSTLTQSFRANFPRAGDGMGLDEGVYDAVYYLAYALAAASQHGPVVTVDDVRRGLDVVTDPSGERVDVGAGAGGLERALQLLADQVAFDTHGSSGPARFDSGHSRADLPSVSCWDGSGALRTIATQSADTSAAFTRGQLPHPCGEEVLR